MSIERSDGMMNLACNECGESQDPGYENFGHMIDAAVAAGWSVKPNGSGGWEHKCPDCKGDTSLLATQRKMFGL